MEKTINEHKIDKLASFINDEFKLEEVDIKSYSPLALAYIGDGVFELIVRNIIIGRGNTSVSLMHKRACKVTKAKGQADLYFAIKDKLTEEESLVFKRGRNAKTLSIPKNATIGDYKAATGLETLIGYLYLTDQFSRIINLLRDDLELLLTI